MPTPEVRSPEREGAGQGTENEKTDDDLGGEMLMEFPDGSTARVRSREEAIRKIQEYREQIH